MLSKENYDRFRKINKNIAMKGSYPSQTSTLMIFAVATSTTSTVNWR
jgi:hypothetical protein